MKKISIFLILFIFCTILVVLFRHNSEKEDEKEIFFSKNLEEKYTLHSPKLGNSSKNKIIVFEDFKCPHCRTLYNNIIKKIDDGIEVRYVNIAFLGKDSFVASKASHAVYIYAPEKFPAFHDAMMNQHTNNNQRLQFTEKIIDYEIDKLSLDKYKIDKIKSTYKSKNSIASKYANKDIKAGEAMKVSSVPTIYVNGHYIKNKSSNLKELKKNISPYIK